MYTIKIFMRTWLGRVDSNSWRKNKSGMEELVLSLKKRYLRIPMGYCMLYILVDDEVVWLVSDSVLETPANNQIASS